MTSSPDMLINPKCFPSQTYAMPSLKSDTVQYLAAAIRFAFARSLYVLDYTLDHLSSLGLLNGIKSVSGLDKFRSGKAQKTRISFMLPGDRLAKAVVGLETV